jgi:hypothetical protein
MSLSWRTRTAITAGCWLATFAGMAALDMGPRPVLLACIAAVLAAAVCLLLDLADVAAPASWGASYDPERLRRGADLRIRALQGQLLHGPSMDDGRALHLLLVELIDDRLLAEHGIDRAAQPERADAVLGPTLATFVTSPPPTKQLRDPRFMSSILTHIESI